MDAVYDGTELIFIGLLLFLTPLFHKPISEKLPYGYYQVESVCLVVKGVMMLAVTVCVFASIIQSAFSGGNPVDCGLFPDPGQCLADRESEKPDVRGKWGVLSVLSPVYL